MPRTPLPGVQEEDRPPRRQTSPQSAHDFVVDLARLLHDDKCSDVAVIDVRGRSPLCDYLVIASGTSDRQMKSAMDDASALGETRGFPAFRVSVDTRATWGVVDFVDVIVHLFEPATRLHYDIESINADSPRVAWERPDQVQRNRAGL
ncbi:MAG: ribosome silencing factor [Phycisphaeraceae bacterium]|nr:ribosome silencing factor [Phycisphaerae bacterium]MBX3391491.1 ribosome silencing factor [Phycisphaeraceae bacterium]HRJ49293.1 ribosome silencing factor [Phycisphaerales bacterium]